jgi:hypothetical protein
MASNSPGMYAVTATITRTTPEGYTSVVHTPTIFLHADVQGITSTEGAESIARRLFTEVAGPGATVYAYAVDCTGDHTYPGRVAAY